MSFREKIAWIFGSSLLGCYLVYFAIVCVRGWGTPAAEIAYVAPMLSALVATVVFTVVGSIAVAISEPKEVDRADERDTIIGRYGDVTAHWVLSVAVLLPLGMAMADLDGFWIANVIYLANVLSALSGVATKLLAYRRGFRPW